MTSAQITGIAIDYSPIMVEAIAACTGAISRLDARISVSPMTSAWRRRANWSGYARAIQYQSAELDEIDVFSWGCGLPLPARPQHSTTVDWFDCFGDWQVALINEDPFYWRDTLPTALTGAAEAAQHPALVRALEQCRQHSRIDKSTLPWLGMPFALRDKGLTTNLLPCLTGGSKAFRLKAQPDPADWLATIRSLEKAAEKELKRLDTLEHYYRDARRAILAQFRPGALPALLALTAHQPLLSPKAVATYFNLTIAGASKLLERAVAAGLLVEITQRRSWRLFLAPDLAGEFGYSPPKRGRPLKEPPFPLPSDRSMIGAFEEFDAQMAKIDQMLAKAM